MESNSRKSFVSGNVRGMEANQIMELVCLQVSCMSLKGRRKFFLLNQTGNQELGSSCIDAFLFFLQTAQTAADIYGALQRPALCLTTVTEGHIWKREI